MVGAFSRDSRPERVNRNANEYYNANEADRYTTTSNAIQKELTYKALELLGVQKGDFHFVADIGCGSGLSSRILSLQKLPWIGTDISLDMLSLAQAQQPQQDTGTNKKKNKNAAAAANTDSSNKTEAVSLCKGHLTASDMSQGLPFRNEAFDLAISISAVQWLCYSKEPREAAERFFKSVWRCLKSSTAWLDTSSSGCGYGGRAAFQVYLENDEHKTLLLDAATSAGFLATYFMDYPHRNAAKKFYIVLSKSHTTSRSNNCKQQENENEESSTAVEDEQAMSLSRCCCNLAWPAIASCSLPWLTWREESNPRAARACAPRVCQEHAHVGKRVLRLLRHAASTCSNGGGVNKFSFQLQPPTLDISTYSNDSTSHIRFRRHIDDDKYSTISKEAKGDNSNKAKESFTLEIAVPHKGLMPCGGPCMLQLFLNKESLLAVEKYSVLLKKETYKGRKRERENDDDEIGVDENEEEERREQGKERENKDVYIVGGEEEKEEEDKDKGIKSLETLLFQEQVTTEQGGDLDLNFDRSKSTAKSTLLSPVVRDLVQKFVGCSEKESSEAYYTTSPINKDKNKDKETSSKTQDKKEQVQKEVVERKEEKIENQEEEKVKGSVGSWPEHFRRHRACQLELEQEKESQKNLAPQKSFFYLEHLASNPIELNNNSSTDSTSIAILHATKPPLPEILVLTSNNNAEDSGDGSGSLENVQRQLAALCKQRNACVIGVDMVVHSLKNVSCAWLMYVPELQTTERATIWEQWSQWQQHRQQAA